MRREFEPVVLAAAILGLATGSTVAKPVDEHRPVDADVIVTIKNVNGTITVAGWEKNELQVTGTITGDVDEVRIDGTSKHMRVEARFRERHGNTSGSADLDIKLPVGAGARVDVVNATIDVAKLAGEVELSAVNGDITVSDAPSRIAAKTVNGLVSIKAKCKQVEASTVGGKVVLDGVSGEVEASAVGGSVQCAGDKFDRVKLSSVSGSLDFDGTLGGNATIRMESHSGDITMRLPADVSAAFEASTFSGRINNDFGPKPSKHGPGPGETLSFSTGSGEAEVSATTFAGDVRFVKK